MLLHPALQDVAVIGTPDEEWGEAVTVVVAGKQRENKDKNKKKKGEGSGEKDDSVTLEDIRVICKEHLSSYKMPKKLLEWDGDLPRNVMGKINKKQIKKQLEEEMREKSSNK